MLHCTPKSVIELHEYVMQPRKVMATIGKWKIETLAPCFLVTDTQWGPIKLKNTFPRLEPCTAVHLKNDSKLFLSLPVTNIVIFAWAG